jgi:DNA (cytosine-5)-methyltransferase 1
MLPEPVHFSKGLTREDIPFHPNHWCMKPKSDKFTTGRMIPGEIMGRSFRVLPWDQPSYTVAYGHREVHVHPSGKRRLSVYEAMRLQGFPEKYELIGTLSDQIRIVSEAVAPPVARAIAEQLKLQLELRVISDQRQFEAASQD